MSYWFILTDLAKSDDVILVVMHQWCHISDVIRNKCAIIICIYFLEPLKFFVSS